MLPAVLADTASHIRGVGAVFKVAAASSGEGGLEFYRPL
jgi:hypothetical protein